jgi:hypothetical protein
MSVWLRELFTLAVCRDLYIGTPYIYLNYLDYDVAAHAFGPRSDPALRTLGLIDRAINRVWRVARRVPEHQYDIYILADHGQASCSSYQGLTRGHRLERWIFDEFLDCARAQARESGPESGLMHGIRSTARGNAGVFQHFLNYIEEAFLRREDPEAHERDGVRVIAAGPNAFLYVLDAAAPLEADALEHRFPGLARKLSQSPGIGFVLARSADGPLCFWQGKRYPLCTSLPPAFATRGDSSLILKFIADLLSMPSAGDLVIYGIDAPQGHVSFIRERGAHAGPSPEELHTFIMRPANVVLPAPIHHPVQLYDHFIAYQSSDLRK